MMNLLRKLYQFICIILVPYLFVVNCLGTNHYFENSFCQQVAPGLENGDDPFIQAGLNYLGIELLPQEEVTNVYIRWLREWGNWIIVNHDNDD